MNEDSHNQIYSFMEKWIICHWLLSHHATILHANEKCKTMIYLYSLLGVKTLVILYLSFCVSLQEAL